MPAAFYFLCRDEKNQKTVGLAESFMYSAMSSDFPGMAFGHVPGIDRIAPFSRMGHFRTIWIDPEARVMTDAFLRLIFVSASNLRAHGAEFCTLTTGAQSYALHRLYRKIGGELFAKFFHLDSTRESEAALFLFRIADFLSLPICSRFD